MKSVCAAFLVVLLVIPASGLVVEKAANKATKDRTITKVVKLLQSMLEKSKTDGDNERTLFGKFKCYCDTNEAEKTASIEELTKQIGTLGSEIEELQGDTGDLSSQCAQLRTDMEDNEAARVQAESLRNKANAAFVAEEKDLKAAIDQMNLAVKTLADVGADQTESSGADTKQFMAGKGASLLKLKVQVQKALVAASMFLPKKHQLSVESFLQAPFTGTYTSQSGEIVGILKNMRDTFKDNRANAFTTEAAQKKAFDAFMTTSEEAYDKMSDSYDAKQTSLGGNDGGLATAKGQLSTAETTKANDEEFLGKLVAMCAAKTKDYNDRKMMRANEDAAIAEAISILNSDDAFATFQGSSAGTTGNFIQLSAIAKTVPSVRRNAVKLLQSAARRSQKVSKIVSMLKAENPFDTVLEEIVKMLDLITKEEKADDDMLLFCNSERDDMSNDRDDAKTKIDGLNTDIDTLDDTINNPENGLKFQIAEEEDSLAQNFQDQKDETEERTGDNLNYQADIKNLVSAAEILTKALKVLTKYYDTIEASSLLQRRQTPPATWENDSFSGQKDESSTGAVGMLKFILKETGVEESEAHGKEKRAQALYEDSMTDLKADEAASQKSVARLTKSLADNELELSQKTTDRKDTKAEKKALEEALAKIKPGCDFITSNIDDRKANRVTESRALRKATTLLKATPAYKAAVADQHGEDLGECKDVCEKEGEDHVKCKACLAETSVPGYCAGHKETTGC